MISEAALQEHRIANTLGTKPSRAAQFAPLLCQLIGKLGITELLDYGCGRGELIPALKAPHELTLQLYDPAVDEYKGKAVPMQLVACIDVLQHVEDAFRSKVLDDLERVTGAVLFIVAEGEFGDWLDDLMTRFDVQTVQVIENGFYVIAYAAKPLIEVPDGTVEH